MKYLRYLSKWKPVFRILESDYEEDLLKYLSKALRKNKISVDNQYTIKSGNKYGRVDLVINRSIFIEIKRSIKEGERDRSMGQIIKYQNIIESTHSPLMLLIIDDDLTTIIKKYTDFIKERL